MIPGELVARLFGRHVPRCLVPDVNTDTYALHGKRRGARRVRRMLRRHAATLPLGTHLAIGKWTVPVVPGLTIREIWEEAGQLPERVWLAPEDFRPRTPWGES